jgi:thioredoxin-related protein
MIKALHALILTAAVCMAQAGDGWLTDLEAAKKQAAQEKKAVLIDFTGSDWCPPCKKLKADVFDKEEFKKFAADNLVLVEVDFPRSKPQSPELKKANAALQKSYKIEAYPTIVILDPSGKKLQEFQGYGGEDVKAYIAKIQKALPKRS